jgi:hypothetical protein
LTRPVQRSQRPGGVRARHPPTDAVTDHRS